MLTENVNDRVQYWFKIIMWQTVNVSIFHNCEYFSFLYLHESQFFMRRILFVFYYFFNLICACQLAIIVFVLIFPITNLILNRSNSINVFFIVCLIFYCLFICSIRIKVWAVLDLAR